MVFRYNSKKWALNRGGALARGNKSQIFRQFKDFELAYGKLKARFSRGILKNGKKSVFRVSFR